MRVVSVIKIIFNEEIIRKELFLFFLIVPLVYIGNIISSGDKMQKIILCAETAIKLYEVKRPSHARHILFSSL